MATAAAIYLALGGFLAQSWYQTKSSKTLVSVIAAVICVFLWLPAVIIGSCIGKKDA